MQVSSLAFAPFLVVHAQYCTAEGLDDVGEMEELQQTCRMTATMETHGNRICKSFVEIRGVYGSDRRVRPSATWGHYSWRHSFRVRV
jgi:hypothetical protein